MKNNLIEIINNTIVLKENDDFYQEYENTKWEGCQIKLKSMLDVIKTTPYYQLLLDMYKHIDEQRLYKSETHGINHNERVMLYSTFIAIKENLKEEDIKLLLYGAMYHDIGRKNDLEDEGHGYRSSKLIEKIISNLKEEDLKILKVMMILHSCDDKKLEVLSCLYDIKDKERLKKLCFMLKDADALDRVRLKCNDLNTDFLRYEISKRLVLAACELNNCYEQNKIRTRKE